MSIIKSRRARWIRTIGRETIADDVIGYRSLTVAHSNALIGSERAGVTKAGRGDRSGNPIFGFPARLSLKQTDYHVGR